MRRMDESRKYTDCPTSFPPFADCYGPERVSEKEINYDRFLRKIPECDSQIQVSQYIAYLVYVKLNKLCSWRFCL